MNAPAFRRTAAWTLAALLAIVAGLGEALHGLPGLGHGVIVGDRVLVLGDAPPDARGGFAARACCTGAPCGTSLPVYDEDECPICQILGASFAPAAPLLLPALDAVAEPLVADTVAAASRTPAVYHARAPPLPAAHASRV